MFAPETLMRQIISMERFEGIPVVMLGFRKENTGSAVTLSGWGIICSSIFTGNRKQQILRHEFGHVLQSRYWGTWFYYRKVAKYSMTSYFRGNAEHRRNWTEWTANRFSWKYFGRPGDWSFEEFPVKKI